MIFSLIFDFEYIILYFGNEGEDCKNFMIFNQGIKMQKKIKQLMVFALSVAFCAGAALSIRFHHVESFPLFWLIGMLILRPMYQSNVYWMEASILFVVWLVARGEAGPREMYAYLPLISAVLMLGAHATGIRCIRISVIPLIVVWFMWVSAPAPDEAFFIAPGAMKYLSPCANHHVAPCVMNYKTWFILACTAFGMLVFGYDALRGYPSIFGKSDMIICSHSGNTAHFAREFMKGMNEAGMEVKLHRFHYYKDFNPNLEGDSLVIAFPVSGWKPPWPFVSYLIGKLPRGRGKPAFIIYSSYGGPENAGIVAWTILTLKGYRVAGRHWAIYPMNVATFRLGTKRMWRFIDALTAMKSKCQIKTSCLTVK
jgi:hypothetical protein